MSRIDEALKRPGATAGSTAQGGTPDPADSPLGLGAVPNAADAFISPWDFGQAAASAEPTRHPAPAVQDAPAPSPPAPSAPVPLRLAPSPPAPSAKASSAPVQPTPFPLATTAHPPPALPQISHPPALPSREALAGPEAGDLAIFKGFSRQVVEKLVVTSGAPPACVEQFRKLAGALHQAQIDRNTRVVMISSSIASEGKTLTASNLALTLSESYKRDVLLVDADLRRPTLHELFDIPNNSGLGEGLKAESDRRLPIVKISPKLAVLTAGRPDPDPMSALTSGRMRHIIEEARARFDWVLIDTPPVGLLPDANLLAGMVDGALLVVQAGQTPYALVERAIEALGRASILGVVLNRVDSTHALGGYRYYGYYSKYGRKSR